MIKKHIIEGVRYSTSDPKYDPKKTSYAYTYSKTRDGILYISDRYGTGTNDMFSLTNLITTVTHEARHQCQAHHYYEPSRYNLPSYEKTNWFDYNTYPDKLYWIRPWEIDIRAYSSIVY